MSTLNDFRQVENGTHTAILRSIEYMYHCRREFTLKLHIVRVLFLLFVVMFLFCFVFLSE